MSLFARAVVRARLVVVLGWVAAAILAAVLLPTLEEAQTGALGQVAVAGSDALEAERLSAELFAFPLASRTLVVERAANGLGSARLELIARQARAANEHTLDVADPPLGAYGVTNAVPGLPFARERGTTAVVALLYGEDLNQEERVAAAHEYLDALPSAPVGDVAGVTGTIPARAAQAGLIADRLPLVELVTVLLVAVTVAAYLRSALAPLVTLLTIGVAYVVSVRVAAVLGTALDIAIPPEVEPVMVALIFGVVTDYGLFYMSRFRRHLAEADADSLAAARRTTKELTPVVLACGLAVAAGTSALVVADLGFLRAFGPGMAMAVLLALAVTLTLLPALLALAGPRLVRPRARRSAGGPHPARPRRIDRLVAHAVRAPRRTIAASLVVIAVPAAGLGWLELGSPLIRGLPDDSEPHRSYRELTAGFAPGVAAPATLVVTAPGIARRRDALASLQQVLSAQPGVAGVIGPATNPTGRAFGGVLSPTGDAARFVLVPSADPLSAHAVRLLDNLRARTPELLDAVGLPNARALYAGDTAIVSEVIATARGDLLRVLPAVLLAIAVVLAVFLRALVAPVYLVLLGTLAPLAALGLAVVVFQGLLGQSELTYFVPLAAGVLLVALGSDYNIFLVGRVWDEALRRPLPEALTHAAAGASHAISAAGLVLAGSFAVLSLIPIDTFRQLGFVLASGLLIDAFLVRTILTPAVIALVGHRSGWPGGRLRAAAATE